MGNTCDTSHKHFKHRHSESINWILSLGTSTTSAPMRPRKGGWMAVVPELHLLGPFREVLLPTDFFLH